METINPDDLRMSWVEAVEPVRYIGRLLDGNDHEFVYRGSLRVEWDSPRGTFVYLAAMENDPGEEEYDNLRRLVADDVLDAYRRA